MKKKPNTGVQTVFLRVFGTLLGHTWRFSAKGDTGYNPYIYPGAAIYCFWHSQILQFAFGYRRSGICAVISESRDGELAARLARYWGHDVIRGSSTRGGFGALRASLARLKNNGKLAMIPDGPRGPAHRVKQGLAHIAVVSRVPVVPVAAVASRSWRLRSWDRFVIPKPGARITVTFHPPVIADATRATQQREKEVERVRTLIEERLGQ